MKQGFSNRGKQTSIPPVTSGAGVPPAKPTRIGALYLNTTNSRIYQARGTATAADWVILPMT